MRALGVKALKKRPNTVEVDCEKGRADDQDNSDMDSFCDLTAADELRLSRVSPPAFGTMRTPIPPFSVRRRRLWKEPSNDTATFASLSSSVSYSATVRSPLGLLEELFVGDPWQLLVSAILLNRSRRAQVDYILWCVLEQWPTPQALLASTNVGTKKTLCSGNINEHDALRKLIQPLGLKTRRSQGLVQFSKEYLSLLEHKQNQSTILSTVPKPERHKEESGNGFHSRNDVAFHLTRDEILGLYNCGDYVADVYQIFIANYTVSSNAKVEWKNLHPQDHALAAYVEWKRSVETNDR